MPIFKSKFNFFEILKANMIKHSKMVMTIYFFSRYFDFKGPKSCKYYMWTWTLTSNRLVFWPCSHLKIVHDFHFDLYLKLHLYLYLDFDIYVKMDFDINLNVNKTRGLQLRPFFHCKLEQQLYSEGSEGLLSEILNYFR